MWSAQHGVLDELTRLLQLNKDLINFKDGDGYTALHRACYSDKPEAVLFLLKNGADIHSTTEEGKKKYNSLIRGSFLNVSHTKMTVLLRT